MLGEVEDVARARRAEAVDRLEVVAHDRQLAARISEAAHDVDLDAVDVLVLVHEHVLEAVAHRRSDDLIARERAPVEQQIVEVEHAQGTLARAVGAEARGERLAVLGAPRK